jgi:hypothetical protein
MEFEAFLLGLEPLTALAVGVGAMVLVPAVSAVGKATGNDNLAEPLAGVAKENTKKALVLGMEAFDKAQEAFAEAEESFRDLMADAKAEYISKKSEADSAPADPPTPPREVEIASN